MPEQEDSQLVFDPLFQEVYYHRLTFLNPDQITSQQCSHLKHPDSPFVYKASTNQWLYDENEKSVEVDPLVAIEDQLVRYRKYLRGYDSDTFSMPITRYLRFAEENTNANTNHVVCFVAIFIHTYPDREVIDKEFHIMTKSQSLNASFASEEFTKSVKAACRKAIQRVKPYYSEYETDREDHIRIRSTGIVRAAARSVVMKIKEKLDEVETVATTYILGPRQFRDYSQGSCSMLTVENESQNLNRRTMVTRDRRQYNLTLNDTDT